MAAIKPLTAIHYDPVAVGGDLADVVAPPYDVIADEQRAELLRRSPHNIVAVDLPQGGENPYGDAAAMLRAWLHAGVLVRDSEPALWAHAQTYTAPDGERRTRRGFFCRVRVEDYGAGRIRPHERTHPGPKEDRLRLARATRANTSAIFSLYSDPQGRAWGALEPFTHGEPFADLTDADGTRHRLWRVADEEAIAAVTAATAGAELLIADGHHRYETARVYADEVGGEGEHRYVLMCLVALEDPGLTVFPTHRLVRGLDTAQWAALHQTLARDFEVTPVEEAAIAPPADPRQPLTLGYIGSDDLSPRRLVLRDQATADAALAQRSPAYRHLDAGVLEELLLSRALGIGEQDIAQLRNFGYARDAEQAVALVREGSFDAAFIMRPTPVEQVRDVAASGESMPPKSTYFFPKLLTGLLLSPL